MTVPAFKSKYVANGQLFRRKHGFKFTCSGGADTICDLVVPYNVCKLNQLEITNPKHNIQIDFLILDPTGVVLNQYATDVRLPEGGLYRDTSEYEADLILNMTVRMIVKNFNVDTYSFEGNITYHEVVIA